MKNKKVEVKKDSAKLFKDSGLPNPEEFMKVRFVSIIRDVLVERGLGQDEAVETMEISESEVCCAARGQMCQFFRLIACFYYWKKVGALHWVCPRTKYPLVRPLKGFAFQLPSKRFGEVKNLGSCQERMQTRNLRHVAIALMKK